MSKKRRVRAKSAPKGRRFSTPIVAAIVAISAVAIALVARQMVNANAQVTNQTQKKPLTEQEAQQFGNELKGLLNKDGVVVVRHADGSSSLESPNGFQNVTVARVNEDGTVTRSCVDNPRAAASFFGIDPKLVGATAKTPQANQPTQPSVKTTLQ
jgi:hypothetical protein